MSTKSKIGWTNATWNPVTGCTPVSPGCLNCYAARGAVRMEGNPNLKVSGRYKGLAVVRDGRPVFNGTIRLHEDRLLDPLGWRKPRMVFVNSQSDLFHEDVPFEFIDRVFAVMALCQRHTFQVLTKRANRQMEYLDFRDANGFDTYNRCIGLMTKMYARAKRRNSISIAEWKRLGLPDPISVHWPLPNVVLGFSAENQECFDVRWDHFRAIAEMGWQTMASCEPLLGPINLLPVLAELQCENHCSWIGFEEELEGGDGACPTCGSDDFVTDRWDFRDLSQDGAVRVPPLDWLIVGGESGPHARPMELAWARSIRDQCAAAGVPCFVKQLGRYPCATCSGCGKRIGRGIRGGLVEACGPSHATLIGEMMRIAHSKGGDINEWPADLRVREFPGAKEFPR